MREATAGVGDLVVKFYDLLWNRWDDSAVETVLAEQFRFRGSQGQETVGRDGWRGYRDQIRAASPDFHNEIVELVVNAQRATARTGERKRRGANDADRWRRRDLAIPRQVHGG